MTHPAEPGHGERDTPLVFVRVLLGERLDQADSCGDHTLGDKDTSLRDWSLITGRGGYKQEGGAHEVLPL